MRAEFSPSPAGAHLLFDPPSLRGIFPRKFGLVSWSAHVPFAFDLMAQLKPRLFVELGTHSGESYFAFCQAAQENGVSCVCYAVDTWKGDPQAGLYDEDVFKEVVRHNEKYYASFSYLLRTTFDEARNQFADDSIDLLHIDGLHTEEAVRHDFEYWLPKVKEGGIILFHDVCVRHGDFGAWRVWDDISPNGYGVAFDHGWGLGVYRKRPSHLLPDAPVLQALFSGDGEAVDSVKRYYAMAAENLRLRKSNGELRVRVEGGPLGYDALRTAAPADLTLRFYLSNADGELRELEESLVEVGVGDWVTLNAPLPLNFLGARLRMDPTASPGVIDILSMRLVSGSSQNVLWEAHGPDKLGAALQIAGTAGSAPHPRYLRIVSHGDDPQLFLPIITAPDPEGPLKLEVTLRALPVGGALGNSLRYLLEFAQAAPGLKAALKDAQQQLAEVAQGQAARIQALEHAQAAAAQAELAGMQFLEHTKAELSAAHARAAALQAELSGTQGRMNHLQAQLTANQDEREQSTVDLIEYQEKLAACETQIEALRAETDSLVREIDETAARTSAEHGGIHREFERTRLEAEARFAETLKTVEGHLRQRESQLDQASSERDEARTGWETEGGRLRAMRRSFSWKLTLPLRAIGRLLAPKKAASLPTLPPSPAAPIAPQKPASSNGEHSLPTRNGSGAHSTKNGTTTNGAGNGSGKKPFRFHIDGPSDWRVAQQHVDIRGWCLPVSSQQTIIGVRARSPLGEVTGQYGLSRPDVARSMPMDEFAPNCGFEVRLPLPPGPSVVQLEVLDDAGTAHPVGEFTARAPYVPLAGAVDAAEDDPALNYAAWIRRYDTFDAAARQRLRAEGRAFADRPLISVLMPTYNSPEKWLTKAIESVRRQYYANWELCIADDASVLPETRRVLDQFAAVDPRIKVRYRESNGHISAASNTALEMAAGEFVALLDHDDELAAHALLAVVAEINAHPEADLIYSDEDKIDENGRRFEAYFKPDWNPDLLTGQNCISHFGVFRAARVLEAGGFRLGFEGCQDWDLALRVTEQVPAENVRHIPRVLYHWRAIAGSTALAVEEKDYIGDSTDRLLREHCERTGKTAEILAIKGGHRRLRYELPAKPPLVSIIIPTRNQVRHLRQCVESIVGRTTYPDCEILIVDNESDDPETIEFLEELDPNIFRVLPYKKPFNFSAINNFAVGEARGDVVCLLNNDTEIITPDWLEEMVGHALRPEIGAVGAMLYYPNDTIQHAGVILGMGGVAGHVFCGLPRGTEGYINRARLTQNLSAVTAACMVLRKSVYLEVGGLEEKRLTVAFNDVDFCLKILEAGYRNVWTPYAELYHHESASRGAEDTAIKNHRFAREVEYMAARWPAWVRHDPAYNPNLTLQRGDCRRACPPRVSLLTVTGDRKAAVARASA